MALVFDDAVYSFVLSNEIIESDVNVHCCTIKDFYLYTDTRTSVQLSKNESGEMLIIIGDIVNVINGKYENVSNELLSRVNSVGELINEEKKYGGKYLILYWKNDENFYCIGDATCSIPLCYAKKDNRIFCCGNPKWIADKLGFETSNRMMKIRKSGDIFQAMPYDLTLYDEIKQLLPNNILNIYTCKTERIVLSDKRQRRLSCQEAVNKTHKMISNIANYYSNKYDIVCPITSGRDSRVVLAYLMQYNRNIECYTINHGEDMSQDLQVPQDLMKLTQTPYNVIYDKDVPNSIVDKFDLELGKDLYSKRTLQIAYTIKDSYKSNAIVNGDIIGQVGKCSLHRDIPYRLATPRYFRCKLHNFSHDATIEISKWMKEIKVSGEQVNLFDLFSIESRMGRWAAQENLIYNMMGQLYLNIFNSRSIIYTWSSVERKERKKAMLNKGYINQIVPELLSVPFEQSGLVERISKHDGISYYIASFAKYYGQMIKFKLKGII